MRPPHPPTHGLRTLERHPGHSQPTGDRARRGLSDSFTRKELANSPLLTDPAEISDQNWGELTLTFDHGRVTFTQRNDLDYSSTSGTYTLDGKAITFTSPRE